MVKLITTNLQSAKENIHSTPELPLHAVLDTSWMDLVPPPVRVRDPGMTLQHVSQVNMQPKLSTFI